MAHFAEIVNGKVARVVVVHNNELLDNGAESEAKGRQFCNNLFGGEWVQTSYNHRIRKQYAGVGFAYLPDADVFVAPQPFPSWSLDENHDWQPPTPYPSDGKQYAWFEPNRQWIELI